MVIHPTSALPMELSDRAGSSSRIITANLENMKECYYFSSSITLCLPRPGKNIMNPPLCEVRMRITFEVDVFEQLLTVYERNEFKSSLYNRPSWEGSLIERPSSIKFWKDDWFFVSSSQGLVGPQCRPATYLRGVDRVSGARCYEVSVELPSSWRAMKLLASIPVERCSYDCRLMNLARYDLVYNIQPGSSDDLSIF
ncbi:unnamed protein product [Citrullus colocynthis]|uniref:Uncharacterized protein n=1 Tax=Citrullus colocynthis TaxID=252529 RepID=A0ABP0XLK3_9ROSI